MITSPSFIYIKSTSHFFSSEGVLFSSLSFNYFCLYKQVILLYWLRVDEMGEGSIVFFVVHEAEDIVQEAILPALDAGLGVVNHLVKQKHWHLSSLAHADCSDWHLLGIVMLVDSLHDRLSVALLDPVLLEVAADPRLLVENTLSCVADIVGRGGHCFSRL